MYLLLCPTAACYRNGGFNLNYKICTGPCSSLVANCATKVVPQFCSRGLRESGPSKWLSYGTLKARMPAVRILNAEVLDSLCSDNTLLVAFEGGRSQGCSCSVPVAAHNAAHNELQHTEAHCITPQHTAAQCSKLQHNAITCNTLQHSAAHCYTLQHSAAHCSILQYTAAQRSTLSNTGIHCNTLQHTATHSNTLKHIATQCSKQQYVATHCNTLQHTAAHCSIMQHTSSF